ncbi:hypothetical protein BH09PSE2_BH09PSE2_09930 [soil metagenome]
MRTISRVIGGACMAGACVGAGAAVAQSDPWTTRPLVSGTGTWQQNAGSGVRSGVSTAGAAAQKGANEASRIGADSMKATSYGMTHAGEVMAKSAKASGQTYEETRSGFMDAAESPLRDLNLMQKQIPATLITAERRPYDTVGLDSCKAITDQVVALDLALGPDVDTPNIEKVRDSYARSASFVAGAALDAVKDATNIIPARNVMRRLTGANRYDRDVRNAILAGAVRRGFLKAFGMMHDCGWPASPISFQPVNGQPGSDSIDGVRTTQAQTIASGPMVVTVSTVSVDPLVDGDTAPVATQRSRLGFAQPTGQERAGAWAIGRPPSRR